VITVDGVYDQGQTVRDAAGVPGLERRLRAGADPELGAQLAGARPAGQPARRRASARSPWPGLLAVSFVLSVPMMPTTLPTALHSRYADRHGSGSGVLALIFAAVAGRSWWRCSARPGKLILTGACRYAPSSGSVLNRLRPGQAQRTERPDLHLSLQLPIR